MGVLGAEPEALRALSGSFRSSAARLDSMAVDLDVSLQRSGWRGPDAARFRATWTPVHRRALAQVADRCRRAATELDRQAVEQTLASAAEAAVSSPHAVGPNPRIGASAGVGPGRVQVPDPPLVETTAAGGLVIGAGFGLLTLDGRVTVADLGGGRAQVTWEDDTVAGLAAAVGASVDVDFDGTGSALPLAGAEASAAAGLGATVRRSWDVPSEAVGGLLAALAVERASYVAVRRTDLPTMAGRAGDAVLGLLTGRDPGLADRISRVASSPAPTHVERLVGIDTSAALRSGAAGNAGGGLSAESSGDVRFGERVGPDGTRQAVVVEVEGDLAHRVGGSLAGALGLPEHAGAARTELRVELHDGSSPELHLTTRTERHGGLTEQRVAVDLRRVADHHGVQRVVDSLRSGRPVEALALLAATPLPRDAIDASVHHPRVERSGGGTGASASVGLGAAVRVRGDVVRVQR